MTATNTPIPLEFDDDADMWNHPVCKTYEANRQGIVRNIFTKNVVGYREKNGYYRFGCNGNCCGENKKYLKHRFIWECFQGLIEDDKIIDHIDNNPSNNKLENLQLITQSENRRKDYKKHDTSAKKIRAINVETW